MGMKLFCVGLTFVETAGILDWGTNVRLIGAVIMVVGCVLLLLDK